MTTTSHIFIEATETDPSMGAQATIERVQQELLDMVHVQASVVRGRVLLRREFEAAYPGVFTWNYLESGPELWRVRIGRATEDGS